MKKLLFLMISLWLFSFHTEGLAVTTVLMENLAFEPATVTVDQGDTVEWNNIDGRFFGGISHTVTSGTDCTYDGTGWDSGTIRLGHSIAVTFDVPGAYPYFCKFHCLSTSMTGTVIVNPRIMPLPAGQQLISYGPAAFAEVSADPLLSMPVGIGTLADGGPDLTIQIHTASFAGPANIFFAFEYAGSIFILTPTGFQTLESAGLAPWLTGVTDALNVIPFGTIPVAALPKGLYTIYFGVTPAGSTPELPNLYLWYTTALVE